MPAIRYKSQRSFWSVGMTKRQVRHIIHARRDTERLQADLAQRDDCDWPDYDDGPPCADPECVWCRSDLGFDKYDGAAWAMLKSRSTLRVPLSEALR